MSPEDLATQLADRTTRAVAASSHDAMVVRGVMRAIAPYIKALQDEIAELRARVDELES